MDGVVSKDDCERKYAVVSQEIEIKKSELDALKDRKREQNETKNRLKQFKETILQHESIDVFSREVFENTVDKVIVGGWNSEGMKDTHMLNFVFKSGVSNKDYIGNMDQSKVVKIAEFECDYNHFIFAPTSTGTKRKVLFPKVKVIVSLNMSTGGKKNYGI